MSDQEKTGGDGGAAGIDYQIKLLLMTLLRTVQNKNIKKNFSLTTEQQSAGKFDDIVLKFEDIDSVKHIRMLQVKHKVNETATITYDDLLIDNNKRLNLKMYYKSFIGIIDQDEFKDNLESVILFSNLNMKNDLQNAFFTEVEDSYKLFKFINLKKNDKLPRLLKLKDSFIPEFQEGQMKKLARTIVQKGFKKEEMKEENKFFSKCHGILSKDVFDVKCGLFNKTFLKGGDDLKPATKSLRDLLAKAFEEEYNKHHESIKFEDANKIIPEKFELKFSSKFGCTNNVDWSEEFTSKADETQLKQFFKYFVLAVNQPNEGELENYLQQEIVREFSPPMSKLLMSELICKFRFWLKRKELKYFERKDVDNVFKIIWKSINDQIIVNESKEYCNELCELGILFKSTPFADKLKDFLAEELSELFYIKSAQNVQLLSLMKVLNGLQQNNRQNYLVINSQNPMSEVRKVIKLFDTEDQNLLIVREFDEESDYKVVLEDLLPILSGEKNKKVILIASKFDDPTKKAVLKSRIKISNSADDTQFDDLTEDVQRKLLEKEVLFQGSRIKFNELYPKKKIRVEDPYSDFWIELIDRRELEISKSIGLSVDYNSQYYINRTISKLGNDEHNSGVKIDTSIQVDSQNILQSFSQKVIILSNSPGMGKSTIFSHWAKMIKQQNPSFWVIRLNGINCASILNEFAGRQKDESSHDKPDELLMNKLLLFQSRTEKFLFTKLLSDEELPNKLVFLFDGFDEINTDCGEVVVGLFKYLMDDDKKNIRMLGLTTRPHVIKFLCPVLNQTAFQLRPFSHQNKIDFLVKFWGSTEIEESHRLVEFAELMVSSLSASISEEDSPSTGNPLLLRMIGEVYRVEMEKYIANGEDSSEKDSITINLYHLYESFLEGKEKIYRTEKNNSSEGLASIDNNITLIWGIHTNAAISILFQDITDETNSKICQECRKRSLHEKNNSNVILLTPCLGMGIMQKQGDTITFIHRTFSEFLVARNLLDSSSFLLSESDEKNEYYFNLMMTKSELIVVRAFVNGRLQKNPEASGILEKFSKDSKFQLSYSPLDYNRMMITLLLDKSFELYEFIRKVFKKYYPKAEPETICFALHKLIMTGVGKYNNSMWCQPYIKAWLIPRLREDKPTSKFIITFLIKQVFFRNEKDPDCISASLDLLVYCQSKLIEEELLNCDDLEEILLKLKPNSVQIFRSFQYVQKYIEDTPNISEPVKEEVILRIRI